MTISVKTQHPIAIDSYDHLYPMGTARDNHRNPLFNQKLYELFRRPIKVLDLGCAGGAFVKDCLDDGHLAVGLEGSDYSQKNRRAEWATIPANLFTCDITKPFGVTENAKPIYFDVVTAWEVLEHIEEIGIRGTFENVYANLDPAGLFICSVANEHSMNDDHPEIDMHRNFHSEAWWRGCARNTAGLVNDAYLVNHFGGQWIRSVSYNFVFRMRAG